MLTIILHVYYVILSVLTRTFGQADRIRWMVNLPNKNLPVPNNKVFLTLTSNFKLDLNLTSLVSIGDGGCICFLLSYNIKNKVSSHWYHSVGIWCLTYSKLFVWCDNRSPRFDSYIKWLWVSKAAILNECRNEIPVFHIFQSTRQILSETECLFYLSMS